MPPHPRKPTGKAKLAGVAGGAAAGLLAIVALFEGYSPDPYRDIVNVPTVCYGETNVPMRRYSREECDNMLAGSLSEYAKGVLERNPTLRGHDPQLVATGSLAYNIGLSGYYRSTVAKRFSEGRWRSACNAFLSWRFAGGREIAGLRKRREAERKICLRDIPAEFDR